MKRFKGVTLLAVLALLVAACGGSTGESAAPSGDEKPAGWLEALGAAEGELNLIIWPGYAERGEYEGFNWVDPLRSGDRLQGQRYRDDRFKQRRSAAPVGAV